MSPRANGRLIDGSISEAAFQGAVLGLAGFYGWRTFHAPDNRPTAPARGRGGRQRVTPGWPDLTLLRVPELIIAELKAERGVLSRAQEEWLDELNRTALAIGILAGPEARKLPEGTPIAGLEVYVWRPSDWDTIEARLARGRVRQSMPAPL